jgi:hypothetical protein
MFYFDFFQWIIGKFLLLILGHILYPMVCEILFSNLYLDLIEFENSNYSWFLLYAGVAFLKITVDIENV